MRSGRVVVITGAAGGMGAAFVDRFLANGDTVVGSDMEAGGLEVPGGDRARIAIVVGDVSSEADCARVADLAGERGGRVDVLVNCAGWFPIHPFAEMTPPTGAGWWT